MFLSLQELLVLEEQEVIKMRIMLLHFNDIGRLNACFWRVTFCCCFLLAGIC